MAGRRVKGKIEKRKENDRMRNKIEIQEYKRDEDLRNSKKGKGLPKEQRCSVR